MTHLTYELSIEGTASSALQACFDDCELHIGTSRTLMRCRPERLRAVVERLESLGLHLLEVRLVAQVAQGE